jgi:hypothetical protein
MPIITSNIEEFTETRIAVDANTYSLTLTNYSNIMLEVVKEEVSASITIPAYAIANISVLPNLHLIIRRQNIDPNALILTGMQIYYSQNSSKISDSIQPLSNLPAYVMKTDITAPVSIEGTIPVTGNVSIDSPVSIEGTVPVTGSVSISAPVSIAGTVGVAGTVGIEGITITDGTIPISGDVNVTGDVNVVQGNVSVVNTPEVTVAAPITVDGIVEVQGNVDVSGSAVTVASGNVSIVNTPAVTVDGSVSLEAGTTVNIGSMPNVNIAGITVTDGNLPVTGNVTVNGSVTVASGNVSIVNTPAVTVDGSISLEAGTTVNIGSMPNVTLASGTVVNIGTMPNVTIAGTPTVNIGSGSITVNSGNINIANAPDVNVQSSAPQPGQGYCATITAYVGSAYNAISEVMFMAKNPLQPANQLPASEFTKSSRITGFMIAMPKSWINGVSSNVTVTVDFYQRKDTNTPTYAIYTETLGFYYNSSGVTVNPVVYRQIDTPFMANCAIVTVHGTNTTPYYMTYQLAVDAITNNNRIRINGRQGLGVSNCGIIKFEKQFTATGGFSNTIFICPSARYTHLTYAEDELDMNGAVNAMDVGVYDTTGTFRGRIMRQRSPSLLKPTDYNLDIWLPPSYTIKSNITVTTSGVRRLLYIYYELWDIDEPSEFTF